MGGSVEGTTVVSVGGSINECVGAAAAGSLEGSAAGSARVYVTVGSCITSRPAAIEFDGDSMPCRITALTVQPSVSSFGSLIRGSETTRSPLYMRRSNRSTSNPTVADTMSITCSRPWDGSTMHASPTFDGLSSLSVITVRRISAVVVILDSILVEGGTCILWIYPVVTWFQNCGELKMERNRNRLKWIWPHCRTAGSKALFTAREMAPTGWAGGGAGQERAAANKEIRT